MSYSKVSHVFVPSHQQNQKTLLTTLTGRQWKVPPSTTEYRPPPSVDDAPCPTNVSAWDLECPHSYHWRKSQDQQCVWRLDNKFYTLVGSSHPSIWTCLKWFQREHATVTTVIQQDSVGTQPYKRLPQKLVQQQKRLQNLWNDRVNGRNTVTDFLQGVAWNICLQRKTSSN